MGTIVGAFGAPDTGGIPKIGRGVGDCPLPAVARGEVVPGVPTIGGVCCPAGPVVGCTVGVMIVAPGVAVGVLVPATEVAVPVAGEAGRAVAVAVTVGEAGLAVAVAVTVGLGVPIGVTGVPGPGVPEDGPHAASETVMAVTTESVTSLNRIFLFIKFSFGLHQAYPSVDRNFRSTQDFR